MDEILEEADLKLRGESPSDVDPFGESNDMIDSFLEETDMQLRGEGSNDADPQDRYDEIV